MRLRRTYSHIKAISPVISIILIMMVGVGAVVSLNVWMNSYLSSITGDVSSQQKVASNQILDIKGNTLYFKSNSDSVEIKDIKVSGQSCSINKNFSEGVHAIDLDNCSSNLGDRTVQELVMHTNQGVYEQQAIIDSSRNNTTTTPDCAKLSSINPSYQPYRPSCDGSILHVGSGRTYATPAAAISAADQEDIILMDAGTYQVSGDPNQNDSVLLAEKDLLFIGNGSVTIEASSEVLDGILSIDEASNGTNPDVYVEHLTLKGAYQSSGEGAGIHVINGNLTLVGSTLQGNEHGINAESSSDSLTIIKSTFLNNGDGSGNGHGILAENTGYLNITGSAFNTTNSGNHIDTTTTTYLSDSTVHEQGSTYDHVVEMHDGKPVTIKNSTIYHTSSSISKEIFSFAAPGSMDKVANLTISESSITNTNYNGTLVYDYIGHTVEFVAHMKDNTITSPTNNLSLANGRYVSKRNQYSNGTTMEEGMFDPKWPFDERSLPAALGKVPAPMSEFDWKDENGVYHWDGWGNYIQEGTPNNDVFESSTKGTKTMNGGKGDDLYLPWGQSDVNESAGEGRDWVVMTSGGWAHYMPDHIEGFVLHGDESYRQDVSGNDLNNIMIGGTVGNNNFNGAGGNDTFYGGEQGNNKYQGGSGHDTVVYRYNRSNYTILPGEYSNTITRPSGVNDTIENDIEVLQFADQNYTFS